MNSFLKISRSALVPQALNSAGSVGRMLSAADVSDCAPRLGGRRMVSPRTGITLIEVTFAIGVILIGMVGLTAILPLAGHRAQDALDFDTAAAMSDGVLKEVVARNLIRDAALTGVQNLSYSSGGKEFTVIQPFCLDPLLADNTAPAVYEKYDMSWFPFYSTDHDPLVDPSSTYTISPGFAGQPRLQRVGLNAFSSYTFPQRFEIARTWVESPNDLSELRPKDRTIPAVLTGLKATTGANSIIDGKRIPTGAYSWMITVDPDEQSRYGSMAVVIYQSRERTTDFPSAPVETANQNAAAERIALVGDAIGFAGGAGGSVQLLSSGATLSQLTSGNWLMLSRTTRPAATPPAARVASQVFRWYRVVGVDGEPTVYTPTNDTTVGGISVPASHSSNPRSNTTVWSLKVMLDGPDWDFSTAPSTDATTNSLTYATLVEDVVAVNEKTILLADFLK
ncbi:type IV pilus modification PilV family protein [Allorhodopirellula heiligendammensis]|nr:hypothetical protein [Allorhodopirellula heiligendammensis]